MILTHDAHAVLNHLTLSQCKCCMKTLGRHSCNDPHGGGKSSTAVTENCVCTKPDSVEVVVSSVGCRCSVGRR